jgi:Na+/H+ antiporter NhaD/arsenite permease-like protein
LAVHEVAYTLLAEYLPFMILLLALYTVAGGIHIRGNLHATPALNTALLAIGTVLASIMGTTGAAMLMIRPLLRAMTTAVISRTLSYSSFFSWPMWGER